MKKIDCLAQNVVDVIQLVQDAMPLSGEDVYYLTMKIEELVEDAELDDGLVQLSDCLHSIAEVEDVDAD